MKITGVLDKVFRSAYHPLCRSYVRHFVKDQPADAMLRSLCRVAFLYVYGYWPNFTHPRLFAERLWDRMLRVRNPLLTLVSDKYLVRNHIERLVGSDYLVPLLWVGERPEEIPYDRLPRRFVIKTNHGCGYNVLVPDKTRIEPWKATSLLKKWLSINYAQDMHLGIAWGYRNIHPVVLVEEFLGDGQIPPEDYKFYCFAGRAEIVTVHLDRYGEKKSIAVTRDFERLRFRPSFRQYALDVPKPPNFGAMVELAERLSEGFNFIRVDLYNVDDRIYFGELTPYPVGISKFVSFDIRDVDRTLGNKWGTNPDWV